MSAVGLYGALTTTVHLCFSESFYVVMMVLELKRSHIQLLLVQQSGSCGSMLVGRIRIPISGKKI
jgi:hypothetical protein